MFVSEVVRLTLIRHNEGMSYIPANYDNWLEKPYQDMCDAETTVSLICSDDKEEGDLYCDFEGEVDAYITDESSGRRWWSRTIEGECPRCGAPFVKEEGDYDDYEAPNDY